MVIQETCFSYKPIKKVYLSSPVHEECPSYYTLRIRLAPQGTGFHDVPVVRIEERIHWTKLRKQHTYYVPPYASVMMFSHIETCESLERRSLFNLSTSSLQTFDTNLVGDGKEGFQLTKLFAQRFSIGAGLSHYSSILNIEMSSYSKGNENNSCETEKR